MRTRALGRTGIEVSEIGFGASGFWGDRLFGEAAALEVLRTAMEQGINFVDTGANYSGFNAEPRLGRCLAALFKERPRGQWVISSKGGTLSAAGSVSNLWRKERKDFSLPALEASILRSLERLGCGYLDVFFLHGFTQRDATDKLLQGLQKLRADGLFRALGVNTHTLSDMAYLAAHADVYDVALIDYNLIARDREPLIAQMASAGLGVVAGTVLAQGHLLPKRQRQPASLSDLWYLARATLKPSGRALAKASEDMRRTLGQRTDVTPAQACFEFVLGNPGISSAIFGTTKPAHVRDVCAASVA